MRYLRSETLGSVIIFLIGVYSTGKLPAAVHAAVGEPQDQQALVACGASTQKTHQASKCKCSL